MGGGTADERPTAKEIPSRGPIIDHRRHEMASLPIPDELMVEIFLRLPTPADLARASAACVSFRHVAADRAFLRQYRKLHAPPLLGFLEHQRKVFHPAAPPHPSAPAANAAALAADFSFSFLPAPAKEWHIKDMRDGRVLLYRFCPNETIHYELVVCDPLHRGYLRFAPVAYDLATSVEDPVLIEMSNCIDVFLAPPGYDEEASTTDETSFRVIWLAQYKATLAAFVFSSNTGQWRGVPSRRWSDLSACLPPSTAKTLHHKRHYVYGCFYWATYEAGDEENILLILDIKTMKFSIAKPPPGVNSCCDFAIVEAGEGKPGLFMLLDCGLDLSYFIRQNDGVNSCQWQKVKTISLVSRHFLICNMEKYLVLYQRQSRLLEAGCFTLDIKTFQHEKVCTLGSNIYKVHAYSNFPPSLLSPPTISSGIREDAEKPMLEHDAEVLPAEEHSHHDQNTCDTSARGQVGVSSIGDGAD